MAIALGAVVLLVLAGGAFVTGRLLGAGSEGSESSQGRTVTVATADGQVVKAEWVPSPDLPQTQPDVAGVYEGRQDTSIFVDQTEGGFVLIRGDDDAFTVGRARWKRLAN
jgi:hypothetical protein